MMKRFVPAAWRAPLLGAAAALVFGGCVFQSTYNDMLQQQQAIEASLRAEIDADQVEIQQLKNGIQVRMASDLLYGEGAVGLTERGRAALSKVAPQLASQTYEIDVVGNTDNLPIGPGLEDRYPTNWELAGERASIVVRFLQEQGVDPSRMRAISAGEYHPVASNDTPEGRKQNRRTDVVLRPR
jgi:chemotaxis protein MotB